MTRTPRRFAYGDAAQVAAYTGPSREIIVNTDTWRLHVQDGSTAGGKPLALFADLDPLNTRLDAAEADIAQLAPLPVPPQGRLTLTSGVPVMGSDVVGATAIYFAPSGGRHVPIKSGSGLRSFPFTASANDNVGLTLTLGSNWAANTIFDVFVALSGGIPVLCTGPAWASSTPGSASRGTGAGTTELAIYQGMPVNAVAMTARTGNATTLGVAANEATYLGSILIAASAGTVDFKFGSAASGGGAAVLGVYNAWNQQRVAASVLDSGATYTYSLAAYRQARGSAGNQATVLVGLTGSMIEAIAWSQATNSTGGVVCAAGVGVNSTTVNSAKLQQASQLPSGASGPATAVFSGSLGVGLHAISRLEYAQATGTTTWYGGSVTGIQAGLELKWLN